MLINYGLLFFNSFRCSAGDFRSKDLSRFAIWKLFFSGRYNLVKFLFFLLRDRQCLAFDDRYDFFFKVK